MKQRRGRCPSCDRDLALHSVGAASSAVAYTVRKHWVAGTRRARVCPGSYRYAAPTQQGGAR